VRVLIVEWSDSDQTFVEDHAEGVDVGCGADELGLTSGLFGSHMGGSAHDRLRLG
jgi:hypothetical protein